MISQSCEIDHSECHCGGGRHTVSQICQARSPDKNLGAMDPRAPVNRDCCDDWDGQVDLKLHLSVGQVILFPYFDH